METGNLTSNSSGIMRHARRSTKTLGYAIPYTIASGSFSLVGGVSNLVVMFILLKYVGLKQNTFVYMLSLFFSDFLYNCVIRPQVCYYQFPSSVITVFGNKYIHAASLVCILTGSSSLFFASLDKYIFIKHPFFYGNYITKNKTRVVVVYIWLVCIGIGVMRFYGIVLVKDGYLALIATSFVLTILVQIMIFVVAREQDKRIQQLHRSLEHNHPRGDEEENAVQPRASQSSNKAAKTIGFILAVYIASWLPVNIYRQEYRWNGGDSRVYHKWMRIINMMIQLHSCINPWVFVLRSKDMKVGIAKFMRGLGVQRCFGGEWTLDIVCNNGNNVPLSSRAHRSKVKIFESPCDSMNGQEQQISDQGNGGIHTSAKSKKIEGHVNTSYRNSCGNNGSANIRDNDNESSSSQSGNIQGEHTNSSGNKNVTVENDERKRHERNNGSGNSLNKVTEVNVQEEEGMVNGVSGNIENKENRENTCDHRERNKVNDINLVDTRNNDSRGDGMVSSEYDGMVNSENDGMVSSENDGMVSSENDGMVSSENDGSTEYVENMNKLRNSADDNIPDKTMPVRFQDQN